MSWRHDQRRSRRNCPTLLAQKYEIQIVEMDELHHYRQKKSKNSGFCVILTELNGELLPCKGVRCLKTEKNLYKKVKYLKIQQFYTNYWKAYPNFLPQNRHSMTKAQTYTVEGLNSQLSHYLARFHRKTRGNLWVTVSLRGGQFFRFTFL